MNSPGRATKPPPSQHPPASSRPPSLRCPLLLKTFTENTNATESDLLAPHLGFAGIASARSARPGTGRRRPAGGVARSAELAPGGERQAGADQGAGILRRHGAGAALSEPVAAGPAIHRGQP